MRRRRYTAITAIVALLVGVFVATAPAEHAEAANGSDFRAGNIISDSLFFNGSAMSAGQVQSFLNAAVPNCRAGYTCLKNFGQATPTRGAVSGRCSAYAGAPLESAATIIARVGIACGISQKAMIVLLEKEQSLITDTWPTDRQYRSATGYGCPDTADCDTEYYGFFNQVYAAALQFKNYAANPTRWNHVAGRVNSIRFNPDSACGSSSVYIENQATAGLYNYTPYQPNASALANLYGSGDACGAYGNRNFWRIYTDWFGSTNGGPDGRVLIAAEYAAQGGAAGHLGAAVSDILTIAGNGGGLAQAFRNGSIYWGATTGVGALTVRAGAIRDYYFGKGGAEGAVGWPMYNYSLISENGGGQAQVFSGGSVFSSGTGTFLVAGGQRDAYFSRGGAAGILGWPLFDEGCVSPASGRYCFQGFQGGGTYVGPNSGANAVAGPIYNAYAIAGGPQGAWGLPTSAESAIPQNGGGTGQAFAAGSVYNAAGGTPLLVAGTIRDKYFSLGGAGGALGWPTAARACAQDGSCSQKFQRGYLMAAANGTVRIGSPDIDSVYAAAGGANGSLGKAIGEGIPIAGNGGGLGQPYQNGSIYWKDGVGAFAVSGKILDVYFGYGGSVGSLGWPTGAKKCGTPTTSCSQTFEQGTIATSTSGTFTVTSKIQAAYATGGGVTGAWGAPTMNAASVPANGGGDAQAFTGGSAYAATKGDAFFVTGAIRDYYFAYSGSAGRLGWPTSDASCATGTGICTQAFQGGVVYWSAKTGASSVSGPIATAYATAGGPSGAWGWSSGDSITITQNGGGLGQVFANGSAFAKNNGQAFLVSGGVRDQYFSLGGAAGTLGWPTAAAQCGLPDGGCKQTFDGGTVVWSPATGGRVE